MKKKKRDVTASTKIIHRKSAVPRDYGGSSPGDYAPRLTRKQLMNRPFKDVLEFQKTNPELYREIMKG